VDDFEKEKTIKRESERERKREREREREREVKWAFFGKWGRSCWWEVSWIKGQSSKKCVFLRELVYYFALQGQVVKVRFGH
jgi:hypothetical protein